METVKRTDEVMPSWVADWIVGTAEMPPKYLAHLRAQSDDTKTLIRQFPPLCVVRAVQMTPFMKLGEHAVVFAYYVKDGAELLILQKSPKDSFSFPTPPECVEVAGYYRDMLPARIAEALR